MSKPVPETLLKARFQDYILAGLVIFMSVAWLAVPTEADRGEASSARLRHNGRVLAELPLGRPWKRTYRLESGPITVEVVPGKGVHVSDSNCPAKICVHTGWAHKPGEKIVCLPNKLLVEVEGEGQEYDAVIN